MTMIAGATYAWLTLGLMSGLFLAYFASANASAVAWLNELAAAVVQTPKPHTGLSTRAWYAADPSTTSTLLSLHSIKLARICGSYGNSVEGKRLELLRQALSRAFERVDWIVHLLLLLAVSGCA
jgi:hypothetical protein